MVSGWRALHSGWVRLLRYPGVFGLLFSLNLVSATLLALPLALLMVSVLGRWPLLIQQAAHGSTLRVVLELVLAGLASLALGTGSSAADTAYALSLTLLGGLIVAVLLPLMAWLPAAFLGGGVLLTYAEWPNSPHWRRFVWGCWRWFGLFLLVGFVQGLGFVLVVGPFLLIGFGVYVAVGWPGWIGVGLAVLLGGVWQIWCELMRAASVVYKRCSLGYALGAAWQFIRQRPLSITLCFGVPFAMLLFLHLLHRWIWLPAASSTGWWVAWLYLQLSVAVRLAARLWRLASGVALVQGESGLSLPGQEN